MGTRSGDIDFGIIFYLTETLGYSQDEVNTLLNKESGLLGLTGYTDLRDIQQAAAGGDSSCQLAMEMMAYRIRKYIGAYTAARTGWMLLSLRQGWVHILPNYVKWFVLIWMFLEFISIKHSTPIPPGGTGPSIARIPAFRFG